MISGGIRWSRSSKSQLAALFVLLLIFGVAFLDSENRFQKLRVDKIIHAAAGASLAAAFLPTLRRIKKVVGWVFVIGFAWEVAEIFIVPPAAYSGVRPYLIDTVGDLCADIVGAWLLAQLLLNVKYPRAFSRSKATVGEAETALSVCLS